MSSPPQSAGGGTRRSFYALLALLLGLVLGLDLTGTLAPLHHASFDEQSRSMRAYTWHRVALEPVVVGMDDAYVDARREPLALMHEDLALFFDALRLGGARAVGVDIILPQKSARLLARRDQPEFQYDIALLKSLQAAAREMEIYLGATWEPGPRRFRPILIDFLAAARGGQERSPLASVLICPDEDGVVRSLPGGACQPAKGPLPLSFALAGVAQQEGDWRGIDFSLGAAIEPLAFAQVIAWAKAGEVGRLQQAFAGRVVLLGSILRFEDRLRSPLPLLAAEPDALQVPGVLLHAQMLRTLATGGGIKPVPTALLLLLGVLAALPALLPRLAAVSLASLAALLALALGRIWAWHSGYFFSPVMPALLLILAYVARAGFDYWRVERERRFLKRSFEGFVSPQVLKALIDGRVAPDRRGEAVSVAVLFADIRGFTTLAVQRPPREIFALLNAYLARMTVAIHAHRGTIDKFIGDGIMVVFGYPEPSDQPAAEALTAGRAMLEAVAEFNREHAAATLRIGIGIHCGEVLAGAVGSAARYEFTVIGDAVNVAARLEELTKELRQLMVVSRLAWENAGEPAGFVPLGVRPVRGRGEIELMGWGEQS